jgi:hypothetical protein
MLALISAWFVCNQVVYPNIKDRMVFEQNILDGQMEPPYQYRVIEPIAGKFLENLLSHVTGDEGFQHRLAYTLTNVFTFVALFNLLYVYLSRLFSPRAALIGLLIFQVVIPLSVTGFYMEGDFITVVFYLIGLILIQSGHDNYLPLLVGVATFNREQVVFLPVLYALYLISQRKFWSRKLIVVGASLVAWGMVYLGMHLYFGFKPTQYTPALHIAHNTSAGNLIGSIVPLWVVQVVPMVYLASLSYRTSPHFYQLAFLSLGPYTTAFFFAGNMWELAKYLPAYLILLPMALQAITSEPIR